MLGGVTVVKLEFAKSSSRRVYDFFARLLFLSLSIPIPLKQRSVTLLFAISPDSDHPSIWCYFYLRFINSTSLKPKQSTIKLALFFLSDSLDEASHIE
jgi:hypothetical protein